MLETGTCKTTLKTQNFVYLTFVLFLGRTDPKCVCVRVIICKPWPVRVTHGLSFSNPPGVIEAHREAGVFLPRSQLESAVLWNKLTSSPPPTCVRLYRDINRSLTINPVQVRTRPLLSSSSSSSPQAGVLSDSSCPASRRNAGASRGWPATPSPATLGRWKSTPESRAADASPARKRPTRL